MKGIDAKDIAKRYNDLNIIIDDDDKWHIQTKEIISRFVSKAAKKIKLSQDFKILNAGSGGYGYGLPEKNMLHIDLSERHLADLKNSLVANIESIPIQENQFDLIVCVGSVLNYCDPIKVMNEFSRLLKNEGYLILEFESSRTLELLFKKEFNQSAAFVETFFDAHGDRESIWYFSENYIRRLFISYNFEIVDCLRFHIISPLVYRITNNPTFASNFSFLDRICHQIPGLNKLCSNAIFLAQK